MPRVPRFSLVTLPPLHPFSLNTRFFTFMRLLLPPCVFSLLALYVRRRLVMGFELVSAMLGGAAAPARARFSEACCY